MVTVLGPKDQAKRKRMGPKVINTTSHAPGWSRQFSPFHLGPVTLYEPHKATNVENGWQYAKVYEDHVDGSGEPTEDYWAWAKEGWSNRRAVRYPMGKGAVPLYSYWKGEKLDYVEARKRIYIPLYIKTVIQTSAYKTLQQLYQDREEIVLWDFDGYDYLAMGRTLKEVLNDPHKKMGHAFVLAMLLTMKRIDILDMLKGTTS